MYVPAPFAINPEDAPRLRDILAKLALLGYSEKSITERLGLDDLSNLQWRHIPLYKSEQLAGRDPLSIAIDLFLLQGALPPAELDRLFSDEESRMLVATRLLGFDQKGVARTRASLFPVGDILIFSDHAWSHLPHPGYVNVPSDHVMAIGRDSRNLARCTTRREFRTALDLCTGSGVQALRASRHANRVHAVDINPRAANGTRFNAQLSAVTNLEVSVGDLFETVQHETFDLITANPPFVPSPFDSVQYRDGGRSGEDIQKRIVAGLPQHLAAGGMAQIITEIGEHIDGNGEQDRNRCLVHRLRGWLNGAKVDIHILRLGEHTAMEYAVAHASGATHETFFQSVDQWAGNLRAYGYTHIASLLISFQWSDPACGRPWERIESSPSPRRDAGAEIDAAFLAERAARRIDWRQTLKNSSLRRTGPTAILDAEVLGAEVSATSKACVLGRSLRIEHHLDQCERQILDRVHGVDRIAVNDLIAFASQKNINESAALEATRSLLRRQLISY